MHRFRRILSLPVALVALATASGAPAARADAPTVTGIHYSGDHGLRVDVSGTTPAFVEYANPEPESHYVLRFYVRNTQLQMAGGNAFVLFAGYASSDCSGSSQLEIELVRSGEDFLLRVGARENGGGIVRTATDGAILATGWRAIEVDWAAAAEDAQDGAVRALIDGEEVSGLDGLDNDVARIACVRWGAVAGLDPGTSGTLHLDDFDSRRAGPIGVRSAFDDVPTGHSLFRHVHAVYNAEVTAGCAGSSYCPGGSLTRAQMAVFVLAAHEGPHFTPAPCTVAPFADVPASNPFCPWIRELAQREVVSGCGGGNYCPQNTVTRAQMAIFLIATQDGSFQPSPCTEPAFGDVPASSPFCPWIRELALRGVTAGCGGGNYCPNSPNTRGQMAVFLQSTFDLPLPRLP